ncbi:DNA primase [Patescibacteria group bacterium]|nr:DNA primase [Patescibacteria group bacterium]MBU1868629.1 DNA primase [Patescibacteria group bacterium]
MANDAERVKEAVDIVSFVNKYVPLKQAGRSFKGSCPFHEETNPSFTVSPERQAWYCFGCNRGGDVISFLMEKEGLDFVEALKILAQQAGVQLTQSFSKESVTEKERLLELMNLTTRFCHHLLVNHTVGENALKYLRRRGVSDEAIEKFNLGYAPRSWQATSKFLLKRGFRLSELNEAGIVIDRGPGKGWYDRFRGRIMFPLRDHLGRVLGFSGRALLETQTPKYLNSPVTLLFKKNKFLFGLCEGKEIIRAKGEVILVEGNLDIITAHQHQYGNVVATLGTGLTDEQVSLLKRFAQKFFICFDADEAGRKATLRALEVAQFQGIDLKVVRLEGGQDLDQVLRDDAPLFKKSLAAAQNAFDYLVAQGKGEYDVSQPEGKSQLLRFVFPFINKTAAEVVKRSYITLLSEELNIEEAVVLADLNTLQQQAGVRQEEGAVTGRTKLMTAQKGRYEVVCENLLSLIIETPPVVWRDEEFYQLMKSIPDEFWVLPAHQGIWRVISGQLKETPRLDVDALSEQLLALEKKILNLLVMKSLAKIDSSNAFWSQLIAAVMEFKRAFLKKRIAEFSAKIKEAENRGDKGTVAELMGKVREFSEKLNAI